MRDRGKLTRALLVAAALGAAAFVVSRRLTRGNAGAAELPSNVRAAVDEGIAAGGNGHAPAAEPEWIPVAAADEAEAEPSEEASPDAGLPAPA